MSSTPAHIREAQSQRIPGNHPAHPHVPAEQDASMQTGGVDVGTIIADVTGAAEQPVLTSTVDMTTREVVHVTVTGPTGSGKSAICGIIAAALKRAQVPVDWKADNAWVMVEDGPIRDLELAEYRPSVRLREVNLSRAPKAARERTVDELTNDLFWLSLEPRFSADKELLCTVAACEHACNCDPLGGVFRVEC